MSSKINLTKKILYFFSIWKIMLTVHEQCFWGEEISLTFLTLIHSKLQLWCTVSSILEALISSDQISWSTLATLASASSIWRNMSFLWILICSISSWENSWDSKINCFSSLLAFMLWRSAALNKIPQIQCMISIILIEIK